MRNAELWKRVLNNGIHGLCSMTTDKATEESLLGKILSAPIIVDPRPTVAGKDDWATYIGVGMPFQEFWIEGKTSSGIFWGSAVKVQSTSNPDIQAAICLCVLNEINGPSLIGQAYIEIDRHGIGSRPPGIANNPHWGPNKSGRIEKIAFDASTVITYSVCDTLLLLSCKNVSLKAEDGDPKQVRRAVKRYGGDPSKYRYHTLVVRPAGSKPSTPGQDIGIMPRHVCRGHFSEYGPEFGKGLLFGKYAGRFFVPPHMKGDKKNGVVEKDYEIPAGAQ